MRPSLKLATPAQSSSLLFSLVLALLGSACKPIAATSELSNIYKSDESSSSSGNPRRHPATSEESNWTVEAAVRGCSGILISPKYMLLNAHCNARVGDLYRSGRTAVARGENDLKVIRIVEQGSKQTIDYALLEVSWITPMSEQQTFPPFIALSPKDLLLGTGGDDGDRLFTVGYPSDKEAWATTYAEGQAKSLDDDGELRFNIGVINGSSGGGLIKKDNFMLVGLVRAGTYEKGDAGWNKNDPSLEKTWNIGVPSWEIAKISKTFAALYPNGKHYLLRNEFVPKTQIFLGVEDLASGPILWVTGGSSTNKIIVCDIKVISCLPGSDGAEALSFQALQGDRRRFKLPPSKAALDQRSVQVMAYDAANNLLAKRRVKLTKTRGASTK